MGNMNAMPLSLRLDSNVMSMLSSRAELEKQTVEDYTNNLLLFVLTKMPDACPKPSAEAKDAARLRAVKSLRGIIPDCGKSYDEMRREYMEERYGKI